MEPRRVIDSTITPIISLPQRVLVRKGPFHQLNPWEGLKVLCPLGIKVSGEDPNFVFAVFHKLCK